MTIENYKNMQIGMKKNVLLDHFRNYGRLTVRYMEKAEKAASRGVTIMVNYWHRKALKYAEARDKILTDIEALSV